MYWTLELATKLEDAPWPATKEELIDYAMRSGAPMEVIENLQEIEDEGDTYESIEDIWPDYPTNDDDFFFNEEEYLKKIIDNQHIRGHWNTKSSNALFFCKHVSMIIVSKIIAIKFVYLEDFLYI